MAQFRGTLRGQSGHTVSRLGGKNTGMEATVNGWRAGIRVVAYHRDGKDRFDVFRTKGSGPSLYPEALIAAIRE